MRYFSIALCCAAALPAEVNPRELVRQSIVNRERSRKELRAFSFTKLRVDKQFDSGGGIKSTDRDLYKITPVGGDPFEQHIEHNGAPLSAVERQKQQLALEERQRETPREKATRLAKAERERSYYDEIPEAFDFKLLGEEILSTGAAWVLQATPHPGFQPRGRYAQMFPMMEGKLWIDKIDKQWVKADAVAIGNVYFGVFIARLAKGSHIVLEQTRLPDGSWVPQRVAARANARTFLLFTHNFEEDITYSNYHKDGADQPRIRAVGK